MSIRTYTPNRGDLVHMNFSPSSGHELSDRHYALVLSAQSYSRKTRMAIVCGITSRVCGWPFEVSLPAGLLPAKAGAGQVQSVIIADTVRQVDYREREFAFIAAASKDVVNEVLDKLLVVLEED